jgi:hypothetical protein
MESSASARFYDHGHNIFVTLHVGECTSLSIIWNSWRHTCTCFTARDVAGNITLIQTTRDMSYLNNATRI